MPPIEVSGKPKLRAHFGSVLLAAGLDIKIDGSSSQSFTGLIAGHEQIDLDGNPTITGSLVAEDSTSTSKTVRRNRVDDRPTVTYDCGLSPPLQGPLQILASWR